MISKNQQQTSDVFGFKWKHRDSYESPEVYEAQKQFYQRRYGDIENADWWEEYGNSAKVLDVGCGSGFTAALLLGNRIKKINYLGVDISDAYVVAQERFKELGLPGNFERGDMCNLAYSHSSFDVIIAEGVLHHTDSTEKAFKAVAKLLKPGGRYLGYIYKKKGPIREFTDDLIRDKLSSMSPNEAWEALRPLTQFGKLLGELNIDIDIPTEIPLLDIPAGKINLQRFFYWHIFKAFYRDNWKDEEMLHVNYDWFAPKNAHRSTQEELERWCHESNFDIDHLDTKEMAGFTFILRKR